MAPVSQQVLEQGLAALVEQVQQEGVEQAHHEQELEPVFPEPEAGTLHGQIGLAGSVAQFHLPATGIGKDHLPGVFHNRQRFIGKRYQNLRTGPRDHPPQGLFHLGVTDRQMDDACFSVLALVNVPRQPVVYGTLTSANLPGAAASIVIAKQVVGVLANDEAQSPAG